MASRALVVGLAVSGASAIGTGPGYGEMEPVHRAVAESDTGAPVPELTWEPCGPVTECATAAVPLDYDRPHGATVDLALGRVPAADPENRIGSLFINPGGPGGSAADFVGDLVEFYPQDILDRFDIVGFDPRFIGASEPVRCFKSDSDWQSMVARGREVPVTREQEAEAASFNRRLARKCAENGARKFRHMSTANVARDLDVLRAAVGDDQLNFIGYSYGSFLGEIYANLFPDRVRALVLDGVVDPREWRNDGDDARSVPALLSTDAPVGSWEALEAFFEECAAAPDACAFGEGDPAARFAAIMKRLRQGPLVYGPERNDQVTYAQVATTAVGSMYSPFAWPDLGQFLAQVESLAQPGAARLRVDTGELERLSEATYPNQVDGFLGVMCADGRNPLSAEVWAAAGRRQDRVTPYVGRVWAWIQHFEACADWEVRDRDRYRGGWRAVTANPVLIVSGKFDPATPYDGGVAASRLMPGSRLLTLSAYGHASLNAPNTCALERTAEYVVGLELPAKGTVCDPDFGPFDMPSSPAARGTDRSFPGMVQPFAWGL